MRGEKKSDTWSDGIKVLPDWRWTHPTYEFVLNEKAKNIVKVEIDPSQRMADVEPANNSWGKLKD